MKKIVIAGIVGMVLISFVSAGLVDFLSNSVSGSVEVLGPVFYLDGKVLSTDKYYTLKLNEQSTSNSIPTLDGDEELWFISETLGIDSFYDERYDIELEMMTEGGNESLTGSIIAELWIGDENNQLQEELCRTPLLLGIARGSYTPYNLDCVPIGNGGLNNIEDNEKIMLLLRTAPTEMGVKIKIKSSKIEVSAT